MNKKITNLLGLAQYLEIIAKITDKTSIFVNVKSYRLSI